MKKRIFSLLITLSLLVAVISGCGSTSSETTEPSSVESTSEDTSSETEEADAEDEITEINFWCWEAGDGSAGSNALGAEVEAAINEIAEREIGVHVNFKWIVFADYAPQLSNAILNNEQVDIADYYSSGAGTFPALLASNSMMDITSLANENCSETLSLIGDDVLAGTTVNGSLYGIPTYRVLNSNYYIIMRGDILDELGLREKAQNMKTWAEYEEILAAVKESGFEGYPVGGGAGFGMISNQGCIYQGTNISDSVCFDPLGDPYFVLATDENGKAYNLVESEAAQNQYKMFKNWMDKGYMYPDSAYDQTGAKELFNQGVLFSVFAASEYGVEASWRASSGYDVECHLVKESPLNTSNVQKFGLFVPVTSKEPEAALKWANLLYTNPEVMNLITWGIEGKSYALDNGVARYVNDGDDALTSGFHNNDYKIGNAFLCHPWTPNAPSFRDDARKFFEASPRSKYLGLTVDTASLETTVAAIAAVKDEFHGQMNGGFYTDSLYAEYLDKLKEAGVDEYIAAYQSAIDEF